MTWAAGDLHFSYDGAVSAGVDVADAASDCTTALGAIKDDKGYNKLGTSACTTMSATKIVVVLQKGLDGSKLELFAPTATTTAGVKIMKSVSKNNNGRSFKVVRVEHKVFTLGTPDAATTNQFDYDKHDGLPVVRGDELTHKQAAVGTACSTIGQLLSDYSVSTFIHDVTAAASKTTIDFKGSLTNVDTLDASCTNEVTRTTLVVDSMPDAMDVYDASDALLAKSIVDFTVYGAEGSCSVSETVKGTYESDVCSGRGNCDGGSGLCTCHEGYSGETCGTQTVLV